MLSVKPEHVRNILDGDQDSRAAAAFPGKCRGNVALALRINPHARAARVRAVHRLPLAQLWRTYHATACVSQEQFSEYFAGCTDGAAIILDHASRFKHTIPLNTLRKAYDLNPNVSYRWIDCPPTGLLINQHPSSRKSRAG